MPHTHRQQRLRSQRDAFLIFLGALFVSLIAALPIAVARLSGGQFAAVRGLHAPTFAGIGGTADLRAHPAPARRDGARPEKSKP